MSGSGKLDEIEALIAEFEKSGARELHIKAGDFELYLSNDGSAAGIDVQGSAPNTAVPAMATTAVPAATSSGSAPSVAFDVPDGGIVVRAPYLGTFYQSPKPGAPAYVELGSIVAPDTDICLVEVMKLFTAVRADVAGKIHAILATDGQMVQAEQPLFVIVPA